MAKKNFKEYFSTYYETKRAYLYVLHRGKLYKHVGDLADASTQKERNCYRFVPDDDPNRWNNLYMVPEKTVVKGRIWMYEEDDELANKLLLAYETDRFRKNNNKFAANLKSNAETIKKLKGENTTMSRNDLANKLTDMILNGSSKEDILKVVQQSMEVMDEEKAISQ